MAAASSSLSAAPQAVVSAAHVEPLVVCLGSSPLVHCSKPSPAINIEGEWNMLKEAHCEARAAVRLELHYANALRLVGCLGGGPTVVHFAGHCDDINASNRGLVLEQDGEGVVAWVTEVFSEAPPALVVLSACTSAGIAESLRHVGVKFVIALDRDVLDDDAPKFAALFYVNLFKGETVGKAYRMARAGMEMTESDATDRGFRLLCSEADDMAIFAADTSGPANYVPIQDSRRHTLPLPPCVCKGRCKATSPCVSKGRRMVTYELLGAMRTHGVVELCGPMEAGKTCLAWTWADFVSSRRVPRGGVVWTDCGGAISALHLTCAVARALRGPGAPPPTCTEVHELSPHVMDAFAIVLDAVDDVLPEVLGSFVEGLQRECGILRILIIRREPVLLHGSFFVVRIGESFDADIFLAAVPVEKRLLVGDVVPFLLPGDVVATVTDDEYEYVGAVDISNPSAVRLRRAGHDTVVHVRVADMRVPRDLVSVLLGRALTSVGGIAGHISRHARVLESFSFSEVAAAAAAGHSPGQESPVATDIAKLAAIDANMELARRAMNLHWLTVESDRVTRRVTAPEDRPHTGVVDAMSEAIARATFLRYYKEWLRTRNAAGTSFVGDDSVFAVVDLAVAVRQLQPVELAAEPLNRQSWCRECTIVDEELEPVVLREALAASTGAKLVYVFGPAGTGKSHAMRTLALQKMDSDAIVMSVFVELKRFRPSSDGLRDPYMLAVELRDFVVTDMCRIGHIDAMSAHTLFAHTASSGNVSLYLDGLDEVMDAMCVSDDWSPVSVFSAALLAVAQPFVQTIVTSRYFREIATFASELGTSCICFELQQLDAIAAIRSCLDEGTQECAMNDIVTQSLGAASCYPLYLTLYCRYLREGGFARAVEGAPARTSLRDVLDWFVTELLGTGPARVVARRIAYFISCRKVDASWDVAESECRCGMAESEWSLAVRTLRSGHVVVPSTAHGAPDNVEFVHRHVQEFLAFEACAFGELAIMGIPQPDYCSWVLDHGRREACVFMLQMEAEHCYRLGHSAREADSVCHSDSRDSSRRPGREVANVVLKEIAKRRKTFEEFGEGFSILELDDRLKLQSRQADLDVALHVLGILSDGLSACAHPCTALHAVASSHQRAVCDDRAIGACALDVGGGGGSGGGGGGSGGGGSGGGGGGHHHSGGNSIAEDKRDNDAEETPLLAHSVEEFSTVAVQPAEYGDRHILRPLRERMAQALRTGNPVYIWGAVGATLSLEHPGSVILRVVCWLLVLAVRCGSSSTGGIDSIWGAAETAVPWQSNEGTIERAVCGVLAVAVRSGDPRSVLAASRCLQITSVSFWRLALQAALAQRGSADFHGRVRSTRMMLMCVSISDVTTDDMRPLMKEAFADEFLQNTLQHALKSESVSDSHRAELRTLLHCCTNFRGYFRYFMFVIGVFVSSSDSAGWLISGIIRAILGNVFVLLLTGLAARTLYEVREREFQWPRCLRRLDFATLFLSGLGFGDEVPVRVEYVIPFVPAAAASAALCLWTPRAILMFPCPPIVSVVLWPVALAYSTCTYLALRVRMTSVSCSCSRKIARKIGMMCYVGVLVSMGAAGVALPWANVCAVRWPTIVFNSLLAGLVFVRILGFSAGRTVLSMWWQKALWAIAVLLCVGVALLVSLADVRVCSDGFVPTGVTVVATLSAPVVAVFAWIVFAALLWVCTSASFICGIWVWQQLRILFRSVLCPAWNIYSRWFDRLCEYP